jgi:hypothetical protein
LNAQGLTANEVATIDQATVVKATEKAVREEAKKAAFERGRDGQNQGREGPQSGEDTTVVVRGDSSDEGPRVTARGVRWAEQALVLYNTKDFYIDPD